ncbi:MAG: potassium-transporting ATPase subunit KdpA [Hyphomicrobiales bacterium]|nr:potassium-transporting ATPase subunit KdpA [Hyphomicrobiales bacterium]
MWSDILHFIAFGLIILALTPIIGGYMHRVYSGERVLLSPVMGPVERGVYRLAGVKSEEGQHWTRYAAAALALSAAGFVVLYAILRLQHLLPLNPANLPPLSPHLAFNTAVSFVTNTNWQSYGGETTMSHFSQMAGLTVQNFLSAATGMAVAMAVIRGFVGAQVKTVGNFYVDLTRSILYILLPISFITALFLVYQGVPQNFSAPVAAKTLEGADQLIAQGPVASQLAIKQLGTNGGGFFNVNSAHPYENPTPLSNLLQTVFIILVAAGFTYTYGRMAKDLRQGWALFGAMGAVFVACLAAVYAAEIGGNPAFASTSVDQAAGNMEGKEVRFGVAGSSLWAVATTAASNGSVNSMHDSFMPLGGLVLMFLMNLGEIIFGGVGSGLYGMLLFVVLAVFIGGLMVGRTPEYLGKKIESKEVKLSILALLLVSVCVLTGSALAAVLPQGLSSLQDAGPHGLSEILYAYSSASNNNGSAFAGFTANTPYHNTALGVCMLIGRFAFMVVMLAVAGSFALKRPAPVTAGTFPTHTLTFVVLLVVVIVVLQGLTFFPAFALGPIAEHFALFGGKTF